MCGIFGHVGPSDSAQVCIKGLKQLEYRGYDSAGIAGIRENALLFHKELGRITSLEQTLIRSPLALDLAIAHTRWATHGVPTKENAHPHFDEHLNIAVVHNGIIENHQTLRAMLKEKGVSFASETDTEVIAQLVAHFYEGDLLKAVQNALALMQGCWGLALIHKNHPDKILVAAKESPLAIALDRVANEAFISSDANAFQGQDLDVIFLQNGDSALVTAKHIEMYDQTGSAVSRQSEKFTGERTTPSKNGFDHFMLKEIFEQPLTIQQALHGRIDEESGEASLDLPAFHFTQILILACGTSWHAGSHAALFFEEQLRLPARAEIASEFRYRNAYVTKETLIIAISQSGETLDTLAAVREAKRHGGTVIALCNVPNSTLTREADHTLFLKAGPEVSVCSTKAFTSQLSVLALLALHLSKQRLCALKELPSLVQLVLNQSENIQKIAKKYAAYPHFLFLGRHYMYVAAEEASLKLKEITYVHAMAYPAGEMKHGPIALLDENLPVIGLLGNAHTYEKSIANLTEVKARKAPLLALAPQGAPDIAQIADDVLWLPPVCDELACIPYSVACQLFAYYVAKERGTDIDQPRNLAKSVTVE